MMDFNPDSLPLRNFAIHQMTIFAARRKITNGKNIENSIKNQS